MIGVPQRFISQYFDNEANYYPLYKCAPLDAAIEKWMSLFALKIINAHGHTLSQGNPLDVPVKLCITLVHLLSQSTL